MTFTALEMALLLMVAGWIGYVIGYTECTRAVRRGVREHLLQVRQAVKEIEEEWNARRKE